LSECELWRNQGRNAKRGQGAFTPMCPGGAMCLNVRFWSHDFGPTQPCTQLTEMVKMPNKKRAYRALNPGPLACQEDVIPLCKRFAVCGTVCRRESQ
jgi:hypothetical protein